MVAVLREFQGKGFMHKVLEQPFDEAAQKNIPCVLDTDTPLKVKKYIKCGMELCGEKKLKHGISLYTLAYPKECRATRINIDQKVTTAIEMWKDSKA